MKLSWNGKLKIVLTGLAVLVFLWTVWNISACDTESDWKLILRHDVSNSVVFSNDEESKRVNENVADPTSVDKYSRLFELENYRNPNDGKFELKLSYPNKNITNIWKQISNPVTRETRWVDWYEAVDIDSTAAGRWWLEHELWVSTFLDWVPDSGTWRWAVGSLRTYTNNYSIPGPWQIVSLVELYVCVDTTSPIWTIEYSTTNVTNWNVNATVTLNETWSITNNWWSNIYTFAENGSFVFEFTDSVWNTNTATATVNNIDKILPTADINYSFSFATSGNVTAILTWLSEAATITNNNGSNEYIFTENGSFVFEFIDSAWNTNSATATVNNIYPEYQTELSYNNPLLVFPSDIHNYIRTFSDGVNPDRQCIYKTLKIDLWYVDTYAIIPAWTCYTMEGWTTNDLNIYNTIVQKTSNERYNFLFGKAAIKTYFDKPIKFVFNKDMFSGVVVWSLILEPNLYIQHIWDSEYIFDSISHSYYANCTNWLSDISNSQLIHYNDAYIGYTCEGWDFKVWFNIDWSSENNEPDDNTGGNEDTSTWAATVYTTYNTYNTYNNSSSSKKYYNWTEGNNSENYNNGSYNNSDNDDITIEVSDELISKSTNNIIKEINSIALKKWIAINQELLSNYIYGRKNYIITNSYYSEDYLLENIDKKTAAIMLSRYAKQIAKLPEINSINNCKFNDINDLDRSTQNYIINSCKYGMFSPDIDKNFNPNSKIKRTEFADSLLKLLWEDIHGSAYNDISELKEKWILTIIDDRYVTKETVLIVVERLSKLKSSINLWNNWDTSVYTFNKPYKLWYKGIWVRRLQEFLINYGTLEWKTTWYFGPKTLEALYQFQLQEWILMEDSPKHLRGYMWPGTRDAINKMIE